MEIFLEDLTKSIHYELKNDLIFIGDLAQGAFGKVIHCFNKKTKKDVAIKIIDKVNSNLDILEKVKQEISILKKSEHPNIVKFYSHIESSTHFYIEMEYIKYGNLKQWMESQKKITEEEASIIISKILSAVSYLHSNQICHRDIKPENIMLSSENDLNSIKLIDFGLSVENFGYLSNNDYCGTYIYMAPEEIERKSYYISVDIWSIGILMYMLLNNGKHPFYNENEKFTKEQYINKIKNKKNLIFENKISYMAKHFLKKLLEPNPGARYTANQALKHPWITRNFDDEIPLTYSDVLLYKNNIQNMKNLFLINIFLNYVTKNDLIKEEYNNNYNKNNRSQNSNSFSSLDSSEELPEKEIIKYTKKEIFKLNEEYIKKCITISKLEKEKLKQFKEKWLDVESTDEDSSEKKIDCFNDIKVTKEFKLDENNNSLASNSFFNSNNLPTKIKEFKNLKKLRIHSVIKEKQTVLIPNINNKNTNKNTKNKINNHSVSSRRNKKLNIPEKIIINANEDNIDNCINQFQRVINSRNVGNMATNKKKTALKSSSNVKIPIFTTMIPMELCGFTVKDIKSKKLLLSSNRSLLRIPNGKGEISIKPMNLFLSNSNNNGVSITSKYNKKVNLCHEKNQKIIIETSKSSNPSILLPKINQKNIEDKNIRQKNKS